MLSYYTAVICVSWVSLGILCILVYENDRLSKKAKVGYYLTYGVVAVAAFSEWLGVQLSGNPNISPVLIRGVKCADYILTPIVGGTLIGQLPNSSRFRKVTNALLLFNGAFQIVSLFTDWMLVLDDQNRYSHGPFYKVYSAIYFFLLILIVIAFVQYGEQFRRQNRLSLYATCVFAAGGIFIQEVFSDDIRTSYLCLTLGMAFLYIHNMEFSMITADDVIEKNELQILLSQIRPHFLFNSLAVIREIYRTDTEKGDRAILQFSEYLRHNMDSLTRNELIPFQDELAHTKRYLELQQLRFGDELSVDYDLEVTDFALPVLTLQPLAENAVTYGIRKQQERQGIVTIRTRGYPDHYEISVIDNGPGFVPESVPGDSQHSHVGLKNVQEHLRRTCGGELIIQSVPGEGTTARMILPRR